MMGKFVDLGVGIINKEILDGFSMETGEEGKAQIWFITKGSLDFYFEYDSFGERNNAYEKLKSCFNTGNNNYE